MPNTFLTNYTETTFLDRIKDNLRHCKSFAFSVSFIKKAGLILLYKDIEAAVERGCKGRIITSTYQNFTDIESLKSFYSLMGRCSNFECHLDYESFHDNGYSTLGYQSKGYLFEFEDHREVVIGSSNITRYALLKNIEWDVAVADRFESGVYDEASKVSPLGKFNPLVEFFFTSEVGSPELKEFTYCLLRNFSGIKFQFKHLLSSTNVQTMFHATNIMY